MSARALVAAIVFMAFPARAEPVTTADEAKALASKACSSNIRQAEAPQWYAKANGKYWRAYLLTKSWPDANCPLAGAIISKENGRTVCTVCLPKTDRR